MTLRILELMFSKREIGFSFLGISFDDHSWRAGLAAIYLPERRALVLSLLGYAIEISED